MTLEYVLPRLVIIGKIEMEMALVLEKFRKAAADGGDLAQLYRAYMAELEPLAARRREVLEELGGLI